jgi:hypothetical protein
VNAVTGAVTAVTWGRGPALDVTGTVPAVIAVAGRHSLSRRADGPGHLLLVTRRSLAHATLRRGLRDQSCDRSARHESPRSPESTSVASLSVASLRTKPRATPRSHLLSKMSQGRNGPAVTPPPAPGSCPCASQAFDQSIFRSPSPRFFAPSPTSCMESNPACLKSMLSFEHNNH